MSKLYLMVGAPGSGKSTWAEDHINKDTMWISRDVIRFTMLDDAQLQNLSQEEYFSQEKAVYREFIKQIGWCLQVGYNVFADATHLTEKSRNRLLKLLKQSYGEDIYSEVNAICLHTSFDSCVERNNQRLGRKKVPIEHIRNMYNSLHYPTLEEGYANIYHINETGEMTFERRD